MSNNDNSTMSLYDEIYGHLLNYQETDEFKEAALEQRAKEIGPKRVANRKGQAKYRLTHPELVRMRAEAATHKPYLRERQKGLCYYCKCQLPPKRYEIDHIKPLIRGGTNHINNLCVCCRKCNAKKAARYGDE